MCPIPIRGAGEASTSRLIFSVARAAGDTETNPNVETILTIADPIDAAGLRARQISAIVRLLRQAVEARRAH
jgi:hypothetical protein